MKLKDIIPFDKNLLCCLTLSTALFGSGLLFVTNESYNKKSHYSSSYSEYFSMSPKRLIKEIDTPEEAANYITHCLKYESSNPLFVRSFKRVHKEKKADCIEASITAAALLNDNGYDLKYIWMFNEDSRDGHAVYFYQDNKSRLYGTLGIFKEDNNPPIFFNLGEIADFFYFKNYIPMKIDKFMIEDSFGRPR